MHDVISHAFKRPPDVILRRKGMEGYCGVCQSLAKYGKVWWSMAEYGRVWQSMGKYGKVLQSMAVAEYSVAEYNRVEYESIMVVHSSAILYYTQL